MPSDSGDKKGGKLTPVQVLIGHESRMLEKPVNGGFTHKWTLFVRPANKEIKNFTDTKFISKVDFKLHDSFQNPLRTIKDPPFEVSEYGYASFSPEISIHFKTSTRPFRIVYDMNLTLDKHGYNEQTMKCFLKDVDKSFHDLIRRYDTEKKQKRKSPSDDDKDDKKERDERKAPRKSSPMDRKKEKPKKRERERSEDREKDRKHKHTKLEPPTSSATTSHVNKPTAPSKDVPKKNSSRHSTPHTDRSTPAPTESLEVLARKIKKLESGSRLFKIAELLIGLPGTSLDKTSLNLSFNLSSAPPAVIEGISKILAQ